MNSRYDNIPISDWKEITHNLVDAHPLSEEDIVSAVLDSWDKILKTNIGGELQIGVDIFPSPQIMGNYLHEIIPVILSKKYPELWRKEFEKTDKDLVYIPNHDLSVEIKTSSNKNNVFGNRSYGQAEGDNTSGKSKSGYYMTVNFEDIKKINPPKILKIRFGWIDHSDWKAQKSASGQQASLSIEARDNKLKLLYEA
ncbi:ScaI family restriction endonuclease [Clostridium sp.]